MGMVKEQVKKIAEELPEDATWDDLMYELYVKQKVTSAEEAAERGKVVPHEEVRKRVAKR